jgi:hypothetical protein
MLPQPVGLGPNCCRSLSSWQDLLPVHAHNQQAICNLQCSIAHPCSDDLLQISYAAAFWSGFLKLQVSEQEAGSAVLRTGPGQAALRLVQLPAGTKLDHGTG